LFENYKFVHYKKEKIFASLLSVRTFMMQRNAEVQRLQRSKKKAGL
jgi:hypothetical protein